MQIFLKPQLFLYRMKKLTFEQIINKINHINFEKFDLVVAIGKGGIIPGALVANHLNLDIKILWLNFRNENNNPKYSKPKLTKEIDFNIKNKKILLVDDVSRTGKTLNAAKGLLKGNKVKTFVVNGNADYSLYNFKDCIEWPWSLK